MKRHVLLLILVICLGFFLRFYQLGSNPPSLTWDEAAWGYNAYSLGIDGKDEFGRFLPLNYLESFGDFKPPMYAYLDIIPVKVFGLTPFATRFPSAFFGALTVLITYFLVKRLFPKAMYRNWYALAGSLILAVSPWHIMLSRAAFEANVASFYVVCGIWLFLCAMGNKKWLLVLSGVSFVASMYTFNTERVFVPLLVVALVIGFHRTLWQRKQVVIASALTGFLLLLPILPFLFSPQAKLRFQEVNIFSDIDVIKTTNQEIANDNNALWSKIIHNRRLAYSVNFLQHYVDNLRPNFLFIHGDGNPKFSIQDVGQMYLWDIPFFVLGTLFLFRKKEGNWWVIPVWLLLGIIPAATARETPHALRIEATLPTFQLLSAYGLVTVSGILYSVFRKRITHVIVFSFFALLFLNVLYFEHDYYTYYPKAYSGEWQYGYEQSIAYAQSHYNDYDDIQVTQSLGRPYIYYLFFTKTNPSFFRQTAIVSRDPFGFVTVEQFGKYNFVSSKDVKGKTLFIQSPGDVPPSAHVLQTFYLLDKTPVLEAYTL